MESAQKRKNWIPEPVRVLRHRDFAWLWSGALLSFLGSWIQNVGQGILIFRLTGSNSMLGMVSFCNMVPTFILGPFGGVVADFINKRVILIVAQSIFALGALYVAIAVHFGFLEPWHILVVAVIQGMASSFEVPARQSLISKIVPRDELPSAVPLQAMTFNIARIVGPALGGILLSRFGVETCYIVNSISFFALIWAILVIHADLSAEERDSQPISDLIFEGMLYVWRDGRLKMLFLMELALSFFGLFYISQIAAMVHQQLHSGEYAVGWAMTAVGFGAFSGLLLTLFLSKKDYRGFLVLVAMSTFGAALVGLSTARSLVVALPFLSLLGASAMLQLNNTNTLFQLLAPAALRGRVLAMHVWAFQGLGPFGILLFSYFAQSRGLPISMLVGGCCIVVVSLLGWKNRRTLLDTTVREVPFGHSVPAE